MAPISPLRKELHRIAGGICYLKLPQFENAILEFQKLIQTTPNDHKKTDKTYRKLQSAINNFWRVWNEESSYFTK